MDKAESKISGNGHHVAIHDWNPVDEKGSHKSSDRIEHDIEETRDTMDMIVDALSNRFDPRTYYDRAQDLLQRPENRERVKNVLTTAGHRITDSFQRNPLPAILLATGATWMFWESQNRRVEKLVIETPDKKGPSAFEKAKEKTQDIIGTVKEKGTEQYEKIKGKGEDQYEQLKEKGVSRFEQAKERGAQYQSEAQKRQGTYKEEAFEMQEQARERYREGLSRADEAAHNRPVLIGAAVVLAGLVAGLLIPSTKAEKRAMGDFAGKAREKAEETANAAMEKGKETTVDLASKIKGKAEEAKQESKETREKEPSSTEKETRAEHVFTPEIGTTVAKVKPAEKEAYKKTDVPVSQPVNPKTFDDMKLSERKERGESGKNISGNA